MAIPVLLVLAVLWGAFFLWPILSGRSSGRRADSIGDFSYRLGVIGKTGGHRRRRRAAAAGDPGRDAAVDPAGPPARRAPARPGAARRRPARPR